MNQVRNSDGTTDSYHILNGDCLEEQLRQTKIHSNLIIFRECLIEGPLNAESNSSFLETRAEFIAKSFQITTEDYFRKTVQEIQKIERLPEHAEVYLWFENDLFCQVNMWFVISLLAKRSDLKLFRVFPKSDVGYDHWTGFGTSSAINLEQSYESSVQFGAEDLELGGNLWSSYQSGDLKRLMELAEHQSNCFEYLPEVCQAHHDRYHTAGRMGRPERLVQELITNHSKEFRKVFTEFSKRAGVYGFADTQIRKLYDRVILYEKK